MFIFKPYLNLEGLNMASMSLARFYRVATSAVLLAAVAAGTSLAGANPLEDFNSGPMTCMT